MLHFVRKNIQTSIVILALSILLLIAFLFTQVISHTKAADNLASNMSQLLKQLNDNKKPILFQFVVPIVADETLWSIPSNTQNSEDEISRYISSVGDDYVCFDELAGQAYSIRCTPFSNIASISYLNQPK
jgi:hypothetical protein